MKRVLTLLLILTSGSCLYAMEEGQHQRPDMTELARLIKEYPKCYNKCISKVKSESRFGIATKSKKRKCEKDCIQYIGLSVLE